MLDTSNMTQDEAFEAKYGKTMQKAADEIINRDDIPIKADLLAEVDAVEMWAVAYGCLGDYEPDGRFVSESKAALIALIDRLYAAAAERGEGNEE